MADLIDSSYANLDSGNLIPSFFTWLFGGALNFQNGSLWGVGLVLCVAMVSFMIFKAYSTDRAMIVSAIITWIISFLVLKAGWISNGIFFIVCAYTVYAIYKLFEKQSQFEA